jgi:hypothetical protein
MCIVVHIEIKTNSGKQENGIGNNYSKNSPHQQPT